jgi:dephospho-CoA kinase
MLTIALTGGIGSGKTTVCQLFAELGVPIIDADDIAHELTEQGSPMLDTIARTFGDEFIDAQGQLKRDALRKHVFEAPSARSALEAILHPAIRKAIQHQISLLDSAYCILAIPLLVETRQHDLADRILVVDAPEGTQIERVQQRNNFTDEEVSAIMAAQASRQQRLRIADDIIDNSGSLEQLEQQVNALHEQYQRFSSEIE